MENIGTWIATFVVILCILGLLLTVRGPHHNQGTAYVIIRGTTQQEAETQAPRGNWVLIRRIPRQ